MPTPHVDHGAVEGARHGIARSPDWPRVQRAHLQAQPQCAACGESGPGLQVHHIFPFHYCVALGRPDLELDQRNLITLCETEQGQSGANHHLLIGHLDDFQSSNLDVEADAKDTFHGMDAAAIRADPRWKQKEADRLAPLDRMTDADKADFQARMNERFPR